MSGRVVDKMQIDRHYKIDELSQLYSFTPCDMDKRPAPNMPVDEVLKKLLHLHPDKAFKYHEHDSLLENKPEQDLNDDEIREAWQIYEQESRGVPMRSTMGPQMPMVNELNANIFNPNYFTSSLDATSSLLQQMYPAQSTLFSPMDYMNYYLDQSGFRNPTASTSAAKAIIPGGATPSASYLRTQLNSNIPFPTLTNPYFPSAPSISKPASATTAPKRRQSAAKAIPAAVSADNSNLNQLASLQHRIYRKHIDNPTPQNSSANLLIVPDLEPSVIRKTLSQPPLKPSNLGNKVRSNTFTPPKQIQKMQSMQQLRQQVSSGSTNGIQTQRTLLTPNKTALPGQDLIGKTANGSGQKLPNVSRAPVQNSPSQMTKSSGAARTLGNISKTITAANLTSRILKPVGTPQLKPPNKAGNPSQIVRTATALTVQQRPPVKTLQAQGSLGLVQRGPSQSKIVMNPQHRLTPEIVSANLKGNPPSTSVSKPIQLSGSASSPISITKLPSGTQKIAPKVPLLAAGSISFHKIPKDGTPQASPSFTRHISNTQQKGNLQGSVPQRLSASGNILKAISSSQSQSTSQPMGSSQRLNSQAMIMPKSSPQASGIFPRTSTVPQKRPAEVKFYLQ